MVKTINLLPKIAEAELKKGIYRKRVNLASIIVLITVLIIVSGVFTFRALRLNSLDTVKKSSATKESSILSMQVKEVMLRSISSKINRVVSVLNSSPKYSVYIEDLNSLGGGVLFTDMKIEDKTITFSALSPNSDSLTTFINNLLSPDLGGRKFKDVTLSSLSYSAKEGNYKIAVKMEAIKSEKRF